MRNIDQTVFTALVVLVQLSTAVKIHFKQRYAPECVGELTVFGQDYSAQWWCTERANCGCEFTPNRGVVKECKGEEISTSRGRERTLFCEDQCHCPDPQIGKLLGEKAKVVGGKASSIFGSIRAKIPGSRQCAVKCESPGECNTQHTRLSCGNDEKICITRLMRGELWSWPYCASIFDISSTFIPGGKKRDLEVDDGIGCACNRTYISKGCCFESSGIVHEDPEMKMGELPLDL